MSISNNSSVQEGRLLRKPTPEEMATIRQKARVWEIDDMVADANAAVAQSLQAHVQADATMQRIGRVLAVGVIAALVIGLGAVAYAQSATFQPKPVAAMAGGAK